MSYRIDDLSAREIQAALVVDLGELPEEEARAIRDFIDRIGGRENAWMAVEMLCEIERRGS
jgi:hypothetical protein